MFVGQLEAAEEKNKIIECIHLLVDPTICTELPAIRTKRNRYLNMICIALLNNDVPLLIKMLNAVPKVIPKKLTLAERSKRTKSGAVPIAEEIIVPKQGLALGSFQLATDPVLIPATKPKDPPAWEKQGDQQWEYYLGVIEARKKIDKKAPKGPVSKIPQRTCSVHARGCEVNKELVKFGKVRFIFDFTFIH